MTAMVLMVASAAIFFVIGALHLSVVTASPHSEAASYNVAKGDTKIDRKGVDVRTRGLVRTVVRPADFEGTIAFFRDLLGLQGENQEEDFAISRLFGGRGARPGARPRPRSLERAGEEFAAVGDEEGLLLVVRNGRPCLSTGEAARPHPVTVTERGGCEASYAPPGPGYRIELVRRPERGDEPDRGDRVVSGGLKLMEDMGKTQERVCVGAVLVHAQDRRRDSPPLVLLGKREAKRAFYPGVWDVLGGHLEPGETKEQALIRELQEETGVTPTEWRSLGEFREPFCGGDGSVVLHLYALTSWNGTPHNRLPEEHSEVSWFAVEDACRLSLAHTAFPEILRMAVSVATGTEGEKPARACDRLRSSSKGSHLAAGAGGEWLRELECVVFGRWRPRPFRDELASLDLAAYDVAPSESPERATCDARCHGNAASFV